MEMSEKEKIEEIKEAIKKYKISSKHFSESMLLAWEQEYDTIDNLNLAYFIYDRFNKPISLLKSLQKI